MDLVTLLQVVVGNMLIYSTPLILTALGVSLRTKRDCKYRS